MSSTDCSSNFLDCSSVCSRVLVSSRNADAALALSIYVVGTESRTAEFLCLSVSAIYYQYLFSRKLSRWKNVNMHLKLCMILS